MCQRSEVGGFAPVTPVAPVAGVGQRFEQRFAFVARFLHQVLTEVAGAGPHERHDPLERLAFRHGDQAHVFGRTAAAFGGARDALAHRRESFACRVEGGVAHEAPGAMPCMRRSASVSSTGRPITFVSLPSSSRTKRRPSPWIA